MLKRNPDKFLCPSNYIANVQYYLQKNDTILSGDPFILLDAKNFAAKKKHPHFMTHTLYNELFTRSSALAL